MKLFGSTTRSIDKTKKREKVTRPKVVEVVYKRIGIDLSRQINTSIPQQISFVGKLEEDDGAAMFIITEKQQKIIPNLFLDLLIIAE